MNSTQIIALDLLKRSLRGEESTDEKYIEVDWEQAFTFLKEHEVTPFAWHAIKKTPQYAQSVPDAIQARMKSIVMASLICNECLMESQDRILRLFLENGIRCAVLKGTSVAAVYPQPVLRALGDIDLLVEQQSLDAACVLLKNEGYIQTEEAHDFHIGFHNPNVSVELHFAISDITNSKQEECIRAFMDNALENTGIRTIDSYTFPVLSAAHQALSLLLHMERHWAAGGIGLRQLMDWCVFVQSHEASVWQEEIMPVLLKSGLLRFSAALTTACVSYLGLENQHALWCASTPMELAEDMMADILESGNLGQRLAERSTSALFLALDREGETEESLFYGAFRNISRNIRNKYPICRKIPVLFVFYWIYLPLRYWVRSLLGLRLKQSTRKIMKIAALRKKLYHELREYP